MEANATSVETVDSKVLNLAREDIIWKSVSHLLEDVEGKRMDGINMVEFTGLDQDDIDTKVNTLCQRWTNSLRVKTIRALLAIKFVMTCRAYN